MAVDRLLSLLLRAAELAFAAIVAGITGWYLDKSHASAWDNGRFIYTEVVAAISIIAALIWFFPFSYSFTHWPFDFFLFVCWIIAFGLIVDQIGNSCGYVFNWGNASPGGDLCGKFKADMAFTFLSAICWLVSAILGLYFLNRHGVAGDRPSRRWWRSRV